MEKSKLRQETDNFMPENLFFLAVQSSYNWYTQCNKPSPIASQTGGKKPSPNGRFMALGLPHSSMVKKRSIVIFAAQHSHFRYLVAHPTQ